MSQEPVSPDPVKEPAAIAASNTTTAQGPVAGQTGQAAPATAVAQATAQEPGVSDPFDEEAWIQQLRKEKQSAPAEVKPAEPADQPNYVERKDYEKWLYKMGQDMSELKRGNDALTQMLVQSQQNREQNAAPSELDFTTPMTADLRPLQQRTSNTERVAQDALRRATAAQDEAEWTGITMREPEARQYETLVRLVVASNPQIRVGDAYAEVKKAAGGNPCGLTHLNYRETLTSAADSRTAGSGR